MSSAEHKVSKAVTNAEPISAPRVSDDTTSDRNSGYIAEALEADNSLKHRVPFSDKSKSL